MKPIIINGDKFQYYIKGSYTYFCQVTELKPERQFLFWKSKKMIEFPKVRFIVSINIEDLGYTKEYVRKEIEGKYLSLIKDEAQREQRRKEILKGEII